MNLVSLTYIRWRFHLLGKTPPEELSSVSLGSCLSGTVNEFLSYETPRNRFLDSCDISKGNARHLTQPAYYLANTVKFP